MRLGQAVHRRQDVRLFVEPRVESDHPFQRRGVAGVDPQNLVDDLHRGPTLAATQRALHQRSEHLQRLVGVVLFQVQVAEGLADRRIVRVDSQPTLQRGASRSKVALADEDLRPHRHEPRAVLVGLQRSLDDVLRVVVVLRFHQRGDQRIHQFEVLRIDLQRFAEDLDGLVEHAAFQQHPADAVVLLQGLGRRRTQLLHGVQNPATLARDLFVARARDF